MVFSQSYVIDGIHSDAVQYTKWGIRAQPESENPRNHAKLLRSSAVRFGVGLCTIWGSGAEIAARRLGDANETWADPQFFS